MSTGVFDDLRDGITLNLAPLTVGQYHRMIRDGILSDAEPIELIQGTLIDKDSRDHSGGIMTHGPCHLRSMNKLMAIRSQWVTSKPRLYASEGIPIDVIVNLQDEMVEVLTEPSTGDQKFLTQSIFTASEIVAIDLPQQDQLSFIAEGVL